MQRNFFFCLLSLLLLAGCSPGQAAAPSQPAKVPFPTQPIPSLRNPLPTAPTLSAGESRAGSQSPLPLPLAVSPTEKALPAGDAPAPSATLPRPTLAPEAWKELPVIPVTSPAVVEIYHHGLALGNNPHAFSKVGDCGSTPAWFLGDFDRGPKYYSLGDYTSLQPVIQQFQGSFSRTSLAARAGFNAASIFTPLWANRELCESKETPLACEYRLNRPGFALITLGANDVWHPEQFEPQMRRLIEYSIENGVVPILSTKPDNEEGDGSLNATLAALAQEYGLPLWNYWRAVQALPNAGLQEDGVHITWGPNRFDDPQVMKKGWPVRNLTALQALDAVWRAAAGTP